MTPITPEDDKKLDAILSDIDAKLEAQISRLKKKKREKTPSTGFNMTDLTKTRQAFQALAEEDFSLEDSREQPIVIPEKEIKVEKGSTSIFGKLFGQGKTATA